MDLIEWVFGIAVAAVVVPFFVQVVRWWWGGLSERWRYRLRLAAVRLGLIEPPRHHL